jgi:long-chain fatty acid transport protein
MRTVRFRRKGLAGAAGAAVLSLSVGHALGAAFILQENSGSGLGNAYAGGAAASEDADTVFTNPAGMARLKTNQVAAAINVITPSAKFSDNGGSRAAAQQPLGGNGGDAGGTNFDPNLYLVTPINKQWAFGLGINVPFGLKTVYDVSWLGRFQAIKSKVETINVNPALSYTWGNFSVGAGVNWQRLKATFTQKTNYSGALLQAAALNGIAPGSPTFNAIAQATPGLSGDADISGNDSGWGWNIGGEWNIGGADSRSRVGAQYRSPIKYTVTGDANFSNPTLPAVPTPIAPVVSALAAGVNSQRLFSSGFTSDIKLPATANLSFFHTMLNDKWDFMGDVQWTGWNTIQDLTFVRTSGVVLSSTPEHFKNAWRVSVGANYRYTDQWMFRGGLAWDQTPVQDQYRTARLPDNDRTWVAGGAQYKFTPALKLDVGAAYLIIKDSSINNNGTDPTNQTYGLINGNYKNDVWIVSGQLTYSF